jgi:hypothetical protein
MCAAFEGLDDDRGPVAPRALRTMVCRRGGSGIGLPFLIASILEFGALVTGRSVY